MAISIDVNAQFKVDDMLYDASMALPTSAPTGDDPFLFLVTSAPVATPDTKTPLLTLAVGASAQVYVAVQPPMALISGAVGSDIVKELDVVVAEGTYDPVTHKFTA